MPALTPPQVLEQKATVEAVKAAFNLTRDSMNGARLTFLDLLHDRMGPTATNFDATAPELEQMRKGFNAIADGLNFAGTRISAADHATQALVDALDPADIPPAVEPPFIGGVFDMVDASGKCYGWAAKAGTLIHFFVDGESVGVARSHLDRPDVQSANGEPNTGWSFDIPAEIDRSKPHTVRAFVAVPGVANVELSNSPRPYGGAPQPDRPPAFERFVADLSSDDAIKRAWYHANTFYNPGPALPTVNIPLKIVDGLVELPIVPGLNAGPGEGGTACAWQWFVPDALKLEMFCEYDFRIDPNVAVGMDEEGVKLPGPHGAWELDGQPNQSGAGNGKFFSGRLWHGPVEQATQTVELCAYVYSAAWNGPPSEGGQGMTYGEIMRTGKRVKLGDTRKFGAHIRLNSKAADGSWNSDGLFEILLDRQVIYRRENFKARAADWATLQSFFCNVYHGGTKPPIARISYGIGEIVVDNKPITDGFVDMAAPSWRAIAPLHQMLPVKDSEPARTWPLDGTTQWSAYSGLAINTRDGFAYSVAATGHAISNANPVVECDFHHGFAWKMLRASSQPSAASDGPGGDPLSGVSHFPDGRPKGAHRYYDAQWLPIGARGVIITAIGASGGYDSSGPGSTNAYDLNGNDWHPGGFPSVPDHGLTKEAAVCLDERDMRIYACTQEGTFSDLDPSTWTWRVRGFPSPAGGYAWYGSVISPELDSFMFDGSAFPSITAATGDYLSGCNLRTLEIKQYPLRWLTAKRGGWHALTRSTVTGVIYWICNDGAYGFIDPRDWTAAQLGTSVAVPDGRAVYNRFAYVPYMRGVLYLPGLNTPWQFMATEA